MMKTELMISAKIRELQDEIADFNRCGFSRTDVPWIIAESKLEALQWVVGKLKKL